MTNDPTTTLTDQERRTRDAVAELVAALSQADRDECALLARLDPETMGVQLWPIEDTGVFDVRWAGASIGHVSAQWLETGEMPDPWPPAWYEPDTDVTP